MDDITTKKWSNKPINRKKNTQFDENTDLNEQNIDENDIIKTKITQKDNQTEDLELNMCKTLDDLQNYIRNIKHILNKNNLNMVFGSGDVNSDVMLIGEAPGEEENKQSKPFVGASGKLLMSMLEEINITRDHIYITNLVYWQPPSNRTPTDEEIMFFRPILLKHIEIKAPKYILLLGSVATKSLLGLDISISKTRGKIIHWNNIKVIATFHPSYILRMPRQKILVLDDLKLLKQSLLEDKVNLS